ncbi:MAG: PAS domain-containing protein, partial [Elusimicrobiota bacterium]
MPPLPERARSLQGLLSPESRAALDHLLDGVYIVDPDHRILFWSKGAEALTGHSSAEAVGKRCSDGVLDHLDANGDALCSGACPLTEALTTGRPVRKRIYPLHKSGRRFAARVHVIPVKDASGKVVGAMEVFRDVSDEERFYQRQRKFDRLVQQYVSKATYDSMVEAVSKDAEICRDQSAEERFRELQEQVDKTLQLHAGDYDAVLKSVCGESARSAGTKDLTVLFVDVVSFTHLSEHHPPAQVVEFLNQLFTLAAHIIRRH